MFSRYDTATAKSEYSRIIQPLLSKYSTGYTGGKQNKKLKQGGRDVITYTPNIELSEKLNNEFIKKPEIKPKELEMIREESKMKTVEESNMKPLDIKEVMEGFVLNTSVPDANTILERENENAELRKLSDKLHEMVRENRKKSKQQKEPEIQEAGRKKRKISQKRNKSKKSRITRKK